MHDRSHGHGRSRGRATDGRRRARPGPILRLALPALAFLLAAATAGAQQSAPDSGAQPSTPRAGRIHFGSDLRGPGRWGHFDPDRMLERLSSKVDLSAEQEGRIRGLTERFRNEHADALARASELWDALRGAYRSGTRPSHEDVEALAERYGNPGRELFPALRRLREDGLSMLTPEQRSRLDGLRSQGRSDCRGRRGEARPFPGTPPR